MDGTENGHIWVENHHFSGFFKKPVKWWKTTQFNGFLKKPSKWVVFHHFLRFFQKTTKTGGFPPLFQFFKNARKVVVSHPKESFIWPIICKFQAKMTNFGRFFKICQKLVVFHHFWRFFEKTVEMGGFPPLLAVFSKNHQNGWFSTTFYGFLKKPSKWVVFHHF